MQFDIIHTLDAWNALQHDWNRLLSLGASDVPFLRHEYLTAWWQTLGGGEWNQGELNIVTARDGSGELCGIAPLFFSENRDGEPALMLLGSIEISDYLDLIALPGMLPAFVSELFDFLQGNQLPAWRVLDLYNLLDQSPTLPALEAAASRCGWEYEQTCLQHCPYIPLPGDWEKYLAGIDKKQRHEIRRKMRRAQEANQGVRWYIVQDESALDSEMEDFFTLMAQDAEKASFLTQPMRTQMRLAAHAALRSGWLQLAFLEAGGRKAAGYLNFDYANHLWIYNSGLSFDFAELSPGWVLLGHLLQWANEQQRAAFDFMRGNEDYKYRFGAVDRFVMRARIARR
jgi:CelD/BcsL family acetyltransferase involved in cellulose biosynthesis